MSGPPQLRFWGVRGSIPAPGPQTARYGGNTPCVTLEVGGEPLIILDAGTGIRGLGAELARRDQPFDAHLLLSHTHWDHIHGLPFLPGLYQRRNRIMIHGPRPDQGSLRGVLEGLAAPPVFPISPSEWLALAGIAEWDGAPVSLGGWRVGACRLSHPGPTLGFRLARQGSPDVAYVTDNELTGGVHGMEPGWRQKLIDFLRGAGVLIHDSANAEDQVEFRRGWGHSSALQALALAVEAECEKLVLFHHDPDRDDDALEAQFHETCRRAAMASPAPKVEVAREGLALTLERDG